MTTRKTKYVILGLLSDEPLSGYDIKKIVDIRFSFFWNESYGQLYPELKELTRQGLIEEVSDDTRSMRSKTVYSITETGREELKEWLSTPAEKETVRFEILLKLYFSKEMGSDTMIKHIMEFAFQHQKQLEMLDSFHRELRKIDDPSGNHQDVLQVISFGQKVYSAYLEWSDETIHYLKERSK